MRELASHFSENSPGVRVDIPPKVLTPIKAIRAYCLECSAGSVAEVRNCLITSCSLWPYRMGKRPRKEEAPK